MCIYTKKEKMGKRVNCRLTEKMAAKRLRLWASVVDFVVFIAVSFFISNGK